MSNINTLKSIKDKKNKNTTNSDEETQNEFYAGGSENSGQQILGPPTRKEDQDDLIEDVFRSAFKAGAKMIGRHKISAKQNLDVFPGDGFRLDSSPGQSSAVSDSQKDAAKKETIVRKLKMWKNGFSVDDGKLRSYNDTSNAEFLECVKRGKVPPELLNDAKLSHITLHIEDHREIENKDLNNTKPFSGGGHRLGNVTDVFITNSDSVQQSETNEEKAIKVLNTDLSKPTTKIQIRLIDGTKLVVVVNLTHTIHDLCLYIVNYRPIYEASSFVLCTSFPHKELKNESLTIEEADLQGSVVIQKQE